MQKEEVLFNQWVFEVSSALTQHPKPALWKSIIHSLHGAAADLVHYVDPNAPVSQMVNKLELMYGMVASFDILLYNFTGYSS